MYYKHKQISAARYGACKMAMNLKQSRRQAGSTALATNVQPGCQLATTYMYVKLTSNTHASQMKT